MAGEDTPKERLSLSGFQPIGCLYDSVPSVMLIASTKSIPPLSAVVLLVTQYSPCLVISHFASYQVMKASQAVACPLVGESTESNDLGDGGSGAGGNGSGGAHTVGLEHQHSLTALPLTLLRGHANDQSWIPFSTPNVTILDVLTRFPDSY